MDKLDKNSLPFKEGGYEAIFDAAESQHIAAEDAILYSQSLERLRSYQAGVDYAAEQSYNKGIEIGMEKGMAQGMERGMEKGRLIERLNTARILIDLDMDDEFIMLKTGLTMEQVKGLKSQN